MMKEIVMNPHTKIYQEVIDNHPLIEQLDFELENKHLLLLIDLLDIHGFRHQQFIEMLKEQSIISFFRWRSFKIFFDAINNKTCNQYFLEKVIDEVLVEFSESPHIENTGVE